MAEPRQQWREMQSGSLVTPSKACTVAPFSWLRVSLKAELAALLAGVLVIAGCAAEPPLATPTATIPPTPAVREPTRAPTWTAWPEPTEVDPRVAKLKAWYRALGESGPFRGLSMASVDKRNHRIEITLLPLRGARDQLEAAIGRANVPREAVVIDVGCSTDALWRLDNMGRDPREEFLDAMEYSLEAASTAPHGHTVLLKLKLRNTPDEPAQFFTGGRPPHDFIITTADGEEVWNWLCARIRLLPLDGRTLRPGEELEFVGEWEQVDNRGEPVPAGDYLIRSVLEMESPERLVTAPHKLRVFQ